MSDTSFELLGAAETHVVTELRSAIEGSIKEARKIAESLEKIDLDVVTGLMLGADSKQTVITLVAPLQALAKNLGHAELTVMLAEILLKEKTDKP